MISEQSLERRKYTLQEPVHAVAYAGLSIWFVATKLQVENDHSKLKSVPVRNVIDLEKATNSRQCYIRKNREIM